MHHQRSVRRAMPGAKTLSVWKQSLARKHADLESEISQEAKYPLPDTLKIQNLKRRRLRVKEELMHLEGVIRTLGRPEPSVAG